MPCIGWKLEDMCVDDKDMWRASNRDDNEDEIDNMLSEFRKATQAWEYIMFASGG